MIVEGLAYGANDYIHKPFSKMFGRVKTQLQTCEIRKPPAGFVPHELFQSLEWHRITDLALGDMVGRITSCFLISGLHYLAEDMTA
jgi:DNA-binding response OmpR family regulator